MGLTGRSAQKRARRQQYAYSLSQAQLAQEGVFNRELAFFNNAVENSGSYADRLRQQGKVDEADAYLEKIEFVKKHFQTDINKLGGPLGFKGVNYEDEYSRLQDQLTSLNGQYQNPFGAESNPYEGGETEDLAAAREWDQSHNPNNETLAEARARIDAQRTQAQERLAFLDQYGPTRVDPNNLNSNNIAGAQYRVLAELGYGGDDTLTGLEQSRIAYSAQQYRTQRYRGRPNAGHALELLGTGRTRAGAVLSRDLQQQTLGSGSTTSAVGTNALAANPKKKKPLGLQVPGASATGISLG
jgi:hypothetical protein